MLYDNDDYLNGLDHSVHKDIKYIYMPTCNFNKYDYEPGEFYYHEIYSCVSPCPIENPYCFSNPYLPGNNHYPPEPEISKLWHIAKQECNIADTINDIKPNNDCLNERFGRSNEPEGEENCKMYYFWRLEVKSRACMVKNAKLEELDKYQICIPDVNPKLFPQIIPYIQNDDAFLCTKESIAYKQKLIEEAELKQQQEEDAKKRAESEKEEARKILHSNETLLALARQLRYEESEQMTKCMKNHECYNIAKKNDTKCETYNILNIEVRSITCMEKHSIKEKLNAYEKCGLHDDFICLKGDYDKYKYVRDLICKIIRCIR